MAAALSALAVMENMTIKAGQVDVSIISDAMRQAATSFDALLSVLLLLGWLVASVDAYLLGKKMDSQKQDISETV